MPKPKPDEEGDAVDLEQDLKALAIPAGFEPATLCLEGRCSIQLSYGIPYAGVWHDALTSMPAF